MTSIQEALNQGQGEVHLQGWVHRERGSGKFKFIILRDGTNILQCIVEKARVSEEVWSAANSVNVETSLHVSGTLKKDDRAPTGFELVVSALEVIQVAERFPITKDQSEELLLDHRHLWIRSQRLTAVMKVRATVFGAIRSFFEDRSFTEMTPPILSPNACEGGSTLFEVKYYDKTMYLTQSWQLYAEAAIFALNKIYCISPCFRAEKSKTSRHLSEFWMAEMEGAFMHLDDVTENAKELLKHVVTTVLDKHGKELELLKRDIAKLQTVVDKPFPTITYTEALKILKEKEGMDVEWGKDLRTIEEDNLMKHFDTPVVVTEYPKEIMAFYKPEKKGSSPAVALCFDMLAPEGYGEIVGGSEREVDIEELKKGLEKEGEDPATYDWYLDLRRYGSVPHSGYGLGVERIVAWICGLDNIKDAIPFPRTMKRMRP